MKTFANQYADQPVNPNRPVCHCSTRFDRSAENIVHAEEHDFASDAYRRLESLIDEAASTNASEFAPAKGLSTSDWATISVLPRTVAKLKSVRRLVLYGSSLIRIPYEIAEMTNLEELVTYTSYRLHWYPYEITRCKALRRSSVSTRTLYGNYKNKMPFPDLRDPTNVRNLAPYTPSKCSVCDRPFAHAPILRWTSMLVAADVLPLLVAACSNECIGRLPKPHETAFHRPHRGGRALEIPGIPR